MIGFGIDELQAEYVAEIKLRNINKEYILKRTEEIASLESEIADLADILESRRRIRAIIVAELRNVLKKYPSPRKTGIVYENETPEYKEAEDVKDYQVNLFLSREGYFKKITPLSLRMGGVQKYKENDGPFLAFEASNRDELLIFTDRQQVYKTKISDFEEGKASVLGVYLASHLEMDPGENVLYMLNPGDYRGSVVFFFENGKAARVELSAYLTKLNRKKLTGAYSDKSPLKAIVQLGADTEVAVYSTEGRALVFNTALITPKTSRDVQGVAVMTLKPKYRVSGAKLFNETSIKNKARYRARNIPAAGSLLKEEDSEEQQISML